MLLYFSSDESKKKRGRENGKRTKTAKGVLAPEAAREGSVCSSLQTPYSAFPFFVLFHVRYLLTKIFLKQH